MAAHAVKNRMKAHLLLMLALGIPGLPVGCGGADADKPAPVDAAQGKKAQEYLGSYREQMIAANKAKTKGSAESKKSPSATTGP
jgi:hypothetical protein